MKSQTNSSLLLTLQNSVKVASFITISVGLAVLFGWVFDIPILKGVFPGAATMKPNTAICFIALGATLALLRNKDASPAHRRIAQILVGLTLAIGLSTLGEHVFGWNLGIDQLLFRDPQVPESSFPGRPSPITAILFVILALAILLMELDTAQYLLRERFKSGRVRLEND